MSNNNNNNNNRSIVSGRSPFHSSSAGITSTSSGLRRSSNAHHNQRLGGVVGGRPGGGGGRDRDSMATAASAGGGGASLNISLLSTPSLSVAPGGIGVGIDHSDHYFLEPNHGEQQQPQKQNASNSVMMENIDDGCSKKQRQLHQTRDQLRRQVVSCLESSMPCITNAVYFGELLCAVSSELLLQNEEKNRSNAMIVLNNDDVILYARALYANHEYQRCLSILKRLVLVLVPQGEGTNHDRGTTTTGTFFHQLLVSTLLSCRSFIALDENDLAKQRLNDFMDYMIRIIHVVMTNGGGAGASGSSAASTGMMNGTTTVEELPLQNERVRTGTSTNATPTTADNNNKKIKLHFILHQIVSFLSYHLQFTTGGGESKNANANDMIHPISQIAILYGSIYDRLNNPHKSSSWYQAAMLVDPRNMSSFTTLVHREFLSARELWNLVESSFDDGKISDDEGSNGSGSQFLLKQWYMSQLGSLPNEESRRGGLLPEDHDDDDDGQPQSNLLALVVNTTPSVLANAARYAFKCHALPVASALCSKALESDPFCPSILNVYVVTLFGLSKKQELFDLCHLMSKSEYNPSNHNNGGGDGTTNTGGTAAPQPPHHDDGSLWFAMGCYYHLCRKYDVAQQHFCRATRLNPKCSDYWIAFGNSFAATDESDQALAAYRSAQRCTSGNSSVPWLYIGMEYLRTNYTTLAIHFFQTAQAKSNGSSGGGGRPNPDAAAATTANAVDPLACSELAVCYYRLGKYEEAISWGMKALSIWKCIQAKAKECATLQRQDQWSKLVRTVLDFVPASTTSTTKDSQYDGGATNTIDVDNNYQCIVSCEDPYWEPTIYNLGQCFLKTNKYQIASICFRECLRLCPGGGTNFSTYLSLGLACQLLGDYHHSIEAFHQALEVQPGNALVNDLIKDVMKRSSLLALKPPISNPPPGTSSNDGNSSIDDGLSYLQQPSDYKNFDHSAAGTSFDSHSQQSISMMSS